MLDHARFYWVSDPLEQVRYLAVFATATETYADAYRLATLGRDPPEGPEPEPIECAHTAALAGATMLSCTDAFLSRLEGPQADHRGEFRRGLAMMLAATLELDLDFVLQ